VAQLTRGQSLQVWEHGVLMRERLIYRESWAEPFLSLAGNAVGLTRERPDCHTIGF
jgi:hypothetical protein